MSVFFTSDQHFGHSAARGLFRRPFATTPDMDAAMIEAWNAVVGTRDTVWHLGDFAVGASRAQVEDLLTQLHGTKHLIVGNNDPDATCTASGWASVGAFAEIEVDGMYVVLCHYALRVWNRQGKAWNLHGHSHGQLEPLTRQADVGVDVWSFAPVTLETIRARRNSRGRTWR